MEDIIDLKEKEITIALNSLKQNRNRLVTALNKQKELIKKLSYCWGGTNGEKVYDILVKHSKKYSGYISKLDKNIAYLESVRNSYRIADEGLYKKIDVSFEEEL